MDINRIKELFIRRKIFICQIKIIMSLNLAEKISLDNIKKVIEIFLNESKRQGFHLFQNQPTVEVFFKGGDFTGVSLIDEDNVDIKCLLVDNPRPGKFYLFFPIEQLKYDNSLEFLGTTNCYKILEQIKADNAYSINLQRVDKLLKDGHYSIALIFLVSAFENISRDLFYLHHELWFSLEFEEVEDFSEDILKKVGIIIDPKIDDKYKQDMFSYIKEIDGKIIGIKKEKFSTAKKWKDVRYWEGVHNVCRKLGIYHEYIQKKMGNQGKEIERFELLKETLEKSARGSSVLNFQRIYKTGGVKKSFETFFNIKLNHFKNELDLIKENIEKRHQIIHGTLKDDKIDEKMVEDFKAAIGKFISYLGEKIRSLYVQRAGVMFGW